MGYNTEYVGNLKFTKELKTSELAYLNSLFDWDETIEELDNGYVALELLPNFTGIRWNDGEKTRNMAQILNYVINKMRLKMSGFGLEGEFLCQGEDVEDRYKIVIQDGVAIPRMFPHTGSKVQCPKCEYDFYFEDKNA